MKKYSILATLVLIIFSLSTIDLFGQGKRRAGEEPFPAPASYANVTANESAFIALFEDKNIGTTHIYAPRSGSVSKDYPHQGTVISTAFQRFFPGDIARTMNIKGGEPVALYSIRGGNGELYVIRTTDFNGNHSIGLYALNNESVRKVKDLAHLKCVESGCRQMDSWLQDVDGDTRLDIIQKTTYIKTGKKNNKERTRIYSIQRNGTVKPAKKLNVEAGDYQMEKM